MGKDKFDQKAVERSRTYSHLSEVQKVQLVYMVDKQNISIKDASKKVEVNYSTAKNYFQKRRILTKSVHKIKKGEAKLSRIDFKVIKAQVTEISKKITYSNPS